MREGGREAPVALRWQIEAVVDELAALAALGLPLEDSVSAAFRVLYGRPGRLTRRSVRELRAAAAIWQRNSDNEPAAAWLLADMADYAEQLRHGRVRTNPDTAGWFVRRFRYEARRRRRENQPERAARAAAWRERRRIELAVSREASAAARAAALRPVPGDVWDRFCAALRATVTESTWDLWLAPLRPAGAAPGALHVTAPAELCSWLRSRFGRLLAAAAAAALDVGGLPIAVVLTPRPAVREP